MTNFKNRIPVPSEGESNSSSKRTEWETKNHNTETRAILEEDTSYFLRQSVSSPWFSKTGIDVLTSRGRGGN